MALHGNSMLPDVYSIALQVFLKRFYIFQEKYFFLPCSQIYVSASVLRHRISQHSWIWSVISHRV